MKSTIYRVKATLVMVLCSSGLSLAVAANVNTVPSAVLGEPEIPMVQSAPVDTSSFGIPMASSLLDEYRGGFDLVKNDMQLNGSVANNSASNIVSGSNHIADGAFTNASGLPMVIQNSGSNVLIQNATIVNVQFQ